MIVFKLKDPKSSKETPIRMYCYLGIEEFYIYTRLKINPNFWKKDLQKVTTELKVFRLGAQMNLKLKNLRVSAEALALEFINSNIKITKEDFKEKFELSEFGKISERMANTPKLKGFIEHYTDYVNKLTALKGERLANSQQTTLSLIKKCYKEEADKLSFDDIDLKFFKGLMDYILYEKGLSINYAGTTAARLKTFMNITLKEGQHKSTHFLNFKRETTTVENVALKEDEVDRIVNVNLKLLKGHDLARDIFVIECFTGLRYSDASILQDANRDGDYIQLSARKTGKETIIPIHPEVSKILKKYNGFPPYLSSQKVNKYIKEVAQFAKLDRPVIITKKVRGVPVSTKYKLWQLIATHTGRRTALTNMANAGIKLHEIQCISGHSSLQQLQIYLKTNNKDMAKKLHDHSFFNPEKKVAEK